MYKDMTFCPFSDCKNFGDKCFRSLTNEVKEEAIKWWGSEDAPICQYVEKPECYE